MNSEILRRILGVTICIGTGSFCGGGIGLFLPGLLFSIATLPRAIAEDTVLKTVVGAFLFGLLLGALFIWFGSSMGMVIGAILGALDGTISWLLVGVVGVVGGICYWALLAGVAGVDLTVIIVGAGWGIITATITAGACWTVKTLYFYGWERWNIAHSGNHRYHRSWQRGSNEIIKERR